jgi:hypothetical protein
LHAWRIHGLASSMCVLPGPGCVEACQNEQVGQTADEDGYEVTLRARCGVVEDAGEGNGGCAAEEG